MLLPCFIIVIFGDTLYHDVKVTVCFIIVIFGDTLYHDVKVTVCALCVSLWLVSL
jgi:hypothetical protein